MTADPRSRSGAGSGGELARARSASARRRPASAARGRAARRAGRRTRGRRRAPPASRTISCAGGGVDRAAAPQRRHAVERAPPRPGTATTAIEPIARSRCGDVARARRPTRATQRGSADSIAERPRAGRRGRGARRSVGSSGTPSSHAPSPRAARHSSPRPEVVDVAERDVGHRRPVGDRDRERVVRQPALGVQRAVDRVDDDEHVRRRRSRPRPRSSLTAVNRAPSRVQRVELGEDDVLGRRVDHQRAVAALAARRRSRSRARRVVGRSREHVAQRRSAARAAGAEPVGASRASDAVGHARRILRTVPVPPGDAHPRPARRPSTHRRRPAARARRRRAPARRARSSQRFAWLAAERRRAGGGPRARPLGSAAADALRERSRGRARPRPTRSSRSRPSHGFCARLLRDEALEAGLDPFVVAGRRRPTGWRCCSSASTSCTLRRHDLRGNPARAARRRRRAHRPPQGRAGHRRRVRAPGRPRCRTATTRARARARVRRASTRAHDRMLGRGGHARLRRPRPARPPRCCARSRTCARAWRARYRARARRRAPGLELRPGPAAAPAASPSTASAHRGRRRRPGDPPLPRRRDARTSATSAPRGPGATRRARSRRAALPRAACRARRAARSSRPIDDRLDKALARRGRRRGRSRFWRCANERAQAQAVAAEVERLVAREGVAPEDVCVLVRSVRDEGQAVAVALEERAVPYRLVGAAAFFQRAEVRDVLAWLRLLVDPGDAGAVVRALARPPVELRSIDLARVHADRAPAQARHGRRARRRDRVAADPARGARARSSASSSCYRAAAARARHDAPGPLRPPADRAPRAAPPAAVRRAGRRRRAARQPRQLRRARRRVRAPLAAGDARASSPARSPRSPRPGCARRRRPRRRPPRRGGAR